MEKFKEVTADSSAPERPATGVCEEGLLEECKEIETEKPAAIGVTVSERISTPVSADGSLYPPVLYRLIKRASNAENTEENDCFDLLVASDEESCLLTDIARSRRLADALFSLFTSEGVTPLEAPYVIDDLMASPEWID